MEEYEWEKVKEEATEQGRLEREEAKANLDLGYQVDADIHVSRAETWEEIAALLQDVIHGTLLEA